MNKEREFIKSFFQFSIGQWIAALISFVTTPITTWLIIPEEFGKASMFTLAFNLFLNISLLGTDQSFVRMFYEKPEEDRRNLLWESLMPSLSVGFIMFVIIGLFWKELSFVLFEDYSHFLPIFLLGLTVLIGCVERFATLVVRMKQRGIAFSTLRVVNGISNAVFTILYALLVSRTFYAIIVGLFLSHIVSATLAIFLERDLWFGKFKINTGSVKEIIKYGLPFVPTFLIGWIFQSFDKLALRNYCDFTEIGLYSAAFKVVSIMGLIQVGFTNFWVPVSYESYENNPESTGLFEKVSLFISAAMFMLGISILLFKDIIFLLLARSYRAAAQISPFLILMPIMGTVEYVTGQGISFKKKTYWYIVRFTVATIVSIIGNLLLVPIYGAKGAAFTTGVSYIVFFAISTYISQKLHKVNYHLGKFYSATIIFVAVAFINTFVDILSVQVVSAVIGFILITVIYKDQIKYAISLIIDELKRVKNKVANRA